MTILIISFIALHLPSALIRDTKRKYDRLKMINPQKAMDYDYSNFGLFDENLKIKGVDFVLVALFSGFLLAFIPLIYLTEMNWLLVFILNLLISSLSPMIVGVFIPFKILPNRTFLKTSTMAFIVIGLIMLIIGNSIL